VARVDVDVGVGDLGQVRLGAPDRVVNEVAGDEADLALGLDPPRHVAGRVSERRLQPESVTEVGIDLDEVGQAGIEHGRDRLDPGPGQPLLDRQELVGLPLLPRRPGEVDGGTEPGAPSGSARGARSPSSSSTSTSGWVKTPYGSMPTPRPMYVSSAWSRSKARPTSSLN
jgi:hypothetical protein